MNFERYLHYCPCLTVCNWGAVYPVLIFLTHRRWDCHILMTKDRDGQYLYLWFQSVFLEVSCFVFGRGLLMSRWPSEQQILALFLRYRSKISKAIYTPTRQPMGWDSYAETTSNSEMCWHDWTTDWLTDRPTQLVRKSATEKADQGPWQEQ